MGAHDAVSDWLGRVRHDLVKPACWRARDLRDAGGAATESDVIALRRGLLELVDADGERATARAVWRAFRDELEATSVDALAIDALDRFERAVVAAEERARSSTRASEIGAAVDRVVEAVLALDAAFQQLSH